MKGWLLLLTVFLAVAACGRTSGPVEIPGDDLPFDVARPESPTGTPATASTQVAYFVQAGRLVERPREFDATPSAAGGVLRVLLEGPLPEERRGGVATEIPNGVRLLDVSVVDDLARVDLSGEFQEPAPPERIALRVAQVVWTLTALPSVRSVSFSIDGEPIAVTTDGGAAVARRVSRQDYAALAPAR